MLEFPSDFVWGAATSSYQIEGAAFEDGRGESIWDRFCREPGRVLGGHDGRVACDHYHRYRDDVQLLRWLGVGAYRFSIAWPRILPHGRGAVNDAGLDFYDRLVDALLEAGIAPYATLYHWDLPQPLEDEGGWPVRDTAQAFASFADAVSRRLGDRVKRWITHNEPWCASMLGYQQGIHAPGREDWRAALLASHHLLLSHGLAVPVIRSNVPNAEVGITLNLTPAVPASNSAADRDACRHFDGHFNRWFLQPVFLGAYPADMLSDYRAVGRLPAALDPPPAQDLSAISAPLDFLGINYYFRRVSRSETVPEERNEPPTVQVAPEAEWTDMGWEVYPEGMYDILTRVHRDYRPPAIYITENGCSYADGPGDDGRIRDVRRCRYFHDHLAACRRAIQDGVPLRGFFAWSLMDNFEWERGYDQRFGLTWVDYDSQERRPKDSARMYRNIAGANAIPEVFDAGICDGEIVGGSDGEA